MGQSWGYKKMKLLRKRKAQLRAKRAPRVNMHLMSEYYTRIKHSTAALPIPKPRGISDERADVLMRRHMVMNHGQPWHGAHFQGIDEHNVCVLRKTRSKRISMLMNSHGSECILVQEERLLTIVRFSLSSVYGTHENAKWAFTNGVIQWVEHREVPIEEFADGDESLPPVRQDADDAASQLDVSPSVRLHGFSKLFPVGKKKQEP